MLKLANCTFYIKNISNPGLFMSVKTFRDKTLLLNAHRYYDLEVIRTINIPGDQVYMLTRDINGLKHLIPYKYYKNYGVRAGKIINCRLDRINCLGRFFFEPGHPCYTAGKSYSFKFSGFKTYKEKEGDFYTALVYDNSGQIVETMKFRKWPELANNPDYIFCKVVKIKKSRLILMINDKRFEGLVYPLINSNKSVKRHEVIIEKL